MCNIYQSLTLQACNRHNWLKDKSMYKQYLANFSIAAEAVLANKIRSALTALGIIFGVAAVIAMLAVGNGAQQEILDQIKLVGVNNVVITPAVKQDEAAVTNNDAASESQKSKNKFSPGLTLADAKSIAEMLPSVAYISPEIVLETDVIKNGVRRSTKLVGVETAYFKVYNFGLSQGRMFTPQQMQRGDNVCIIGENIRAKFFSTESPIGKYVKCGNNWLKVIGVLEERRVSGGNLGKLGIRDFNNDIYTPLQTMLSRYKNRALVTNAMITRAANRDEETKVEEPQSTNYHQLDKLVIQIGNTEQLSSSAEIISRMLERKHYKVVDYEISIPELLLKQQQRTKDIFNVVLGAIAGISLLVGGIGIMNIMLASVLERIKEIGLRLSIGAKKSDIVIQFLFEAMMISLSGGIVGVILGISMAIAIAKVADIPTIISFSSVFVSFVIAAGIGLIFGIAPARRAAQQDPIASLRYE